MQSKWQIRRDIPLTILGWFAVIAIIFMLLSHVSNALFLLTIAGILAYALVPMVTFLDRFVPRSVGILVVYVLVIFGMGYVFYALLQIAISQFTHMIKTVEYYLIPNGSLQTSPFMISLMKAGFSYEQITEASKQIAKQLENLGSSVIPLLTGIFSSFLDFFIIAILSIYFLLDGPRMFDWLGHNMPTAQRGRYRFAIHTLEKIVGGYIRGQFILSLIIGVLVGIGMFAFQLPYAVLLGLFAFILSFIPFIGTFISGAACVLVGLTKGWFIALLVLLYYIVIHVIEGDILGPKIVGKALGLHPIISLLAVITGTELFGLRGALFSAPIAGILQALLVATWTEWKADHPDDFGKAQKEN